MSLVKNSLATAIVKFSAIAFALLASVILARLMGAASFGVYSLVIAGVTLVALPLQSGLATLTTREVAWLSARGDYSSMKGLFWRVFQLLGILSGAATICIVLLINSRVLLLMQQHWLLLALGVALVLLTVCTGFFGAALIGAGKLLTGQLYDSVIRPASFIAVLLASVVAWQQQLTPEFVLACAVAAAAATALAAALNFFYEFRVTLRGTASRYRTKKWLQSLLPLAFFGLTTTLLTQTDLLLLGMFDSAATVGIYKVSVVGSTLAAFGLTVVNTVNAPRYAALRAESKIADLEALAIRSARGASLFAILLVSVFLLFGRELLTLVFNAEYSDALPMLVILSLAQLINCLTGSVGLILNTSHLESRAAKAVAIAAGVNVVLNLLLIPLFAATGAAVATALSLSISNVLMWKSVKSELGIDVSAWPKGR